MTELGHGSNVMGIETTVRPCPRAAGGQPPRAGRPAVSGFGTAGLRGAPGSRPEAPGAARQPCQGSPTWAPIQSHTLLSPPPGSLPRQANYDAAAGEFIINTPSNEASKIWIGGSGQHGKVCVVFAQLTVGGRREGPHVFVVRLRDDAGRIMPGVRIKDMGPKMGLNGVDNGQIWFDNVRVSRCAGVVGI
jgi:hypothetical protein